MYHRHIDSCSRLYTGSFCQVAEINCIMRVKEEGICQGDIPGFPSV